MANIAIIGYGKMGKEIEKKLFALQHNVSVIIDNEDDWINKANLLSVSDAAIEFSTPGMAYRNCRRCFDYSIPVVTGTTGWNKQMQLLLSEYKEKNVSFVYGTNFSVGANIFFKVNEELAKLMNSQPQYDVKLEEIHHTGKKDKPSGTAITLAEAILDNISRKKGWQPDVAGESDIPVISLRQGQVTGIHQVDYSSGDDTISIRHMAHNREGFSTGAVKSALWLIKHPGIYSFRDIFLTV